VQGHPLGYLHGYTLVAVMVVSTRIRFTSGRARGGRGCRLGICPGPRLVWGPAFKSNIYELLKLSWGPENCICPGPRKTFHRH